MKQPTKLLPGDAVVIRAAMCDMGVDERHLAAAARIHPETLHRRLAGVGSFSCSEFVRIARALGTTAALLIGATGM